MTWRLLFLLGISPGFLLGQIVSGVEAPRISGWVDVLASNRGNLALDASEWQGTLQTVDGKAVVRVGSVGMYHGSGVVLKEPLRIPQKEGEYLHVHFKVYGFSDDVTQGDVSAAARIYLTPAPAETDEPYVMENALLCLLVREKGNPTKIILYQKINHPKGGFGELLYSGMMPQEKWPMGIDLYLGATTFRLTSDQDMEPNVGSRSGFHALPHDLWGGDLRFGLRIVNQSNDGNAQFSFGEVKVSVARHNP